MDVSKGDSDNCATHPVVSGREKHINAKETSDASELLAQIGYKQELKRNMSSVQVFGVAFSIMGILPSVASTMMTGLMGGPATLLWGWFLGGAFVLTIGYCMSELASAIPTSGGLYYWTHYYAPAKWRNLISFVIGLTNSSAIAGGLCSITYGMAVQVLSAVYVSKDGNFNITNGQIYGVFAACTVTELLVCSLASGVVARLQGTSIVANYILVVIFFIALPIGTAKNRSFNDGKFIFGHFENLSDWPDGWAFFQFGLMPVVWTICCFDACVHMSEEAKNPSKSVPRGILGSITACWMMGFFIIIVLNACMDPNVEELISTPSGQPLTQMFYDALGKKWAVAFISLTASCQFLMGCSIMTSLSRQLWAFARDDGFIFSSFVKVVNKRLSVPLRAVGSAATVSLLIGLLILVGEAASSALFSIGVIGSYVAWMTPQILRLTTGRDKFTPGLFHHGMKASIVANVLSVTFMCFIIVLAMFPSSRHPESTSMNYAVVINCGVWVLAIAYYFAYKKRYYFGPKSNLDESETDGISAADSNDILK